MQERRRKERAIALDTSLNDADKICAMFKVRCPETDMAPIDAYLAGTASARDTVELLAGPIEEAYTSADYGVEYYEREMFARSHRQFLSPEEALRRWGPEVDVTTPDEATMERDGTVDQLFTLWDKVLLAARRISYTDVAAQDRLIALVREFEVRRDPAAPANRAVLSKDDWVWGGDDALWREMRVFGPALREHWNISPDADDPLPIDQRSWRNINMFLARLWIAGDSDVSLYGLWAVRNALELKQPGGGRLGLYGAVDVAASWWFWPEGTCGRT